ncbi:MAG: 4Fe-4S binding protein [Candidatus Aenigmarchaeota archaeon]|nr:4Fe-4S binding protein [Candidatus Aenigmarchaeota archaeon]
MPVSIDRKKCVTCGGCVGLCPANAMHLETELKHDVKKCTSCGVCVRFCPAGALELKQANRFATNS